MCVITSAGNAILDAYASRGDEVVELALPGLQGGSVSPPSPDSNGNNQNSPSPNQVHSQGRF